MEGGMESEAEGEIEGAAGSSGMSARAWKERAPTTESETEGERGRDGERKSARGNKKYICTLDSLSLLLSLSGSCGFAGAAHTYGTNLAKLFRNREIPSRGRLSPLKAP